MTTIEELIDGLSRCVLGEVFLINLNHTLERRYISNAQAKIALQEFLISINAGSHSLPSAEELVRRLGEHCVSKGLWKEAPEPIVERHLIKREHILSRITSYGGFLYNIVRRRGAPPTPDLPEPKPIGSINEEIDPGYVAKVRQTINSGKWKDLMLRPFVMLDSPCIWLAPLPKLKKKIGGGTSVNNADFHRDVLGLSHLHEGTNLIRIDIDLAQWVEWSTKIRRRPHGAGNGGSRFRLKYDGRESTCRWGRTVDLARVALGKGRILNGIPELLMEGSSIPKVAIEATFLGPIKHNPENNDTYFIDKLRRHMTVPDIIDQLKSSLR